MEDVEIEEEGVPNTHQEKAARVAELKKHWRQHFQRLQDAIDKDSETCTPAKNILEMYSKIRDIGEDFYEATIRQAMIFYPTLARHEALIAYRDKA